MRKYLRRIVTYHSVTRRADQLLSSINVGSLQADHNWLAEPNVFGSVQDTLSDDIAAHDATKNVHQDGLDLLVVCKNIGS